MSELLQLGYGRDLGRLAAHEVTIHDPLVAVHDKDVFQRVLEAVGVGCERHDSVDSFRGCKNLFIY